MYDDYAIHFRALNLLGELVAVPGTYIASDQLHTQQYFSPALPVPHPEWNHTSPLGAMQWLRPIVIHVQSRKTLCLATDRLSVRLGPSQRSSLDDVE